jgi:hypothetical protein
VARAVKCAAARRCVSVVLGPCPGLCWLTKASTHLVIDLVNGQHSVSQKLVPAAISCSRQGGNTYKMHHQIKGNAFYVGQRQAGSSTQSDLICTPCAKPEVPQRMQRNPPSANRHSAQAQRRTHSTQHRLRHSNRQMPRHSTGRIAHLHGSSPGSGQSPGTVSSSCWGC